MNKRIVEIHSMRSKWKMNMLLLRTVLGFAVVIYVSLNSSFRSSYGNGFYLFLLLMFSLIVFNLWIYKNSFLGYLNYDDNILLLKKLYSRKTKLIKLEDITNTEYESILSFGKCIKVQTKNKDKTDTNDYYILASKLSFISDDLKTLKKAIKKRKEEQTIANKV